jgi:hypothetical protein
VPLLAFAYACDSVVDDSGEITYAGSKSQLFEGVARRPEKVEM